MISILIPYRNREVKRLVNSLDSLKSQTRKEFEVHLIDYGSEESIAAEIKELSQNYSFLKYRYHPSRFQPWNKARALNSVIRELNSDYCFVADVDIFFHTQFIEEAMNLLDQNTAVYFQVGFLEPSVQPNEDFFDQETYRKSTEEATGMTLFPVSVLKEIRGFDEFYHFWGAEDTDIHVRIKNGGKKVSFYKEKTLLLHQWHPSYRSGELNQLSENLQISEITRINQQHLNFASQLNKVAVNPDGWGNCITEKEFKVLESSPLNFTISNRKEQIEDFLYGQLPVIKGEVLRIKIKEDAFQNSLKFKLKKVLQKKTPVFYNMKFINDQILFHLISFYRNNAYSYKVKPDLKEIEIGIIL